MKLLLPPGLTTYTSNATPEAFQMWREMLGQKERPDPAPSYRERDRVIFPGTGLEARPHGIGGPESNWYRP